MTRRTVAFGLLALTLTAVETALMAALSLWWLSLHLSLGVLLFAAVRANDIEGAAIAAIVGYGWDLFSGAPTGLSVAPAVAIFLGARLLSQRVEVAGVMQVAVLAFVGLFLHSLACFGLLSFAGSLGTLAFWPSLWGVLGQSLMASVVVAPVFFLTRWLDRVLGADRAESEVLLS